MGKLVAFTFLHYFAPDSVGTREKSPFSFLSSRCNIFAGLASTFDLFLYLHRAYAYPFMPLCHTRDAFDASPISDRFLRFADDEAVSFSNASLRHKGHARQGPPLPEEIANLLHAHGASMRANTMASSTFRRSGLFSR